MPIPSEMALELTPLSTYSSRVHQTTAAISRTLRNAIALITVLATKPVGLRAQSVILALPDISQHARSTQRIGLTDTTTDYHRPAVAGRKIFGALQPYGEVWRAGANYNTTIEITDSVRVENHPLGRGAYGLHMIPGASSWTVIFSKNATSWGSFTYDSTEDALRVTIKPLTIPLQEALSYEAANYFLEVVDRGPRCGAEARRRHQPLTSLLGQ